MASRESLNICSKSTKGAVLGLALEQMLRLSLLAKALVEELPRKHRSGAKIALDLAVYAVYTNGDVAPPGLEEDWGAISSTMDQLLRPIVSQSGRSFTMRPTNSVKVQDTSRTFRTNGRNKDRELSTLAWTGAHKIWSRYLVP